MTRRIGTLLAAFEEARRLAAGGSRHSRRCSDVSTARGGRTLCRVVGVLWLGATGVVGLAGAGDPATAGVRCGEEESGGGG
eukprot:SAG25_NODE_158_length_13455_cov_15.344714_16_plen_81_part_00